MPAPAPGFNAGQVSVGPGVLRWAPLGSTIPVSRAAAYAAAWKPVGYTADGSEHSTQVQSTDIIVAEVLDVIRTLPTGRTNSVKFSLAQLSVQSLLLAVNGGTVTAGPAGSGDVTYTPPSTGAPTEIMLGWDSDEQETGNPAIRAIFKRCINVGASSIPHKKSAGAFIAVEFKVQIPADNSAPFVYYFSNPYNDSGTAGGGAGDGELVGGGTSATAKK